MSSSRAALLLILCVAGATGCAGEARGSSVEVPTGPGELVARMGVFQDRMLLTGQLEAVRAEPIIVPRTPMWQMPIRWIEADGALVEAGQRVLELDNAQFSGDLEEKRLAEARALNQLMQKRADIAGDLAEKQFAVEQAGSALEKAKLEAAVPVELRARRDHQEKQLELAKATVLLEKAEEDLGSAQDASDAELEELRIALTKARREVQTAEAAIDALTLHAPRAGLLVVSENGRESRKYQIGDNAHVGLTVAKIPDLTAMKVEAWLSDVDDGRIRVGLEARCVLDTYPDRSFSGSVVQIAPIAKEQNWRSMRRAFLVEVELDEADPELMRPGMSAQIEIIGEPRPSVLLVPRSTIEFGGPAPQVLLGDGSRVDVELGPCDALRCVIQDGLQEGTRLKERS